MASARTGICLEGLRPYFIFSPVLGTKYRWREDTVILPPLVHTVGSYLAATWTDSSVLTVYQEVSGVTEITTLPGRT